MRPSEKTVYAYLTGLASAQPDKLLYRTETEDFRTGEILHAVNCRAAWLYHAGLRPGDVVAVSTRRTVPTIVTLYALWAIGCVAALCDPREDLSAAADCVGAKARLEERAGTVFLNGIPACGQGTAFPLATDARVPAMLIFTSGTTGERKAVVLSQYNAVNNLVDAEKSGDYRADDIALGILPFYHIFGMVLLLGTVVLGYSLVLPEDADPQRLLRCVENFRITRMNGVPALYLSMARAAEGYDVSTLRTGFIGGGPCSAEQFHTIEKGLGMTLISAYGMSECVSITISSPADPAEERCSAVGRAYELSRVRILLPNGAQAESGQEGEICVDAPSKMLGYYGDEAATREVIDEEGFLHTGDLGVMDSTGLVRITGRKKEVLIRNGVNLSLRSIEKALLAVPGVEDAAVVALPGGDEGEIPGAMVVSCRSREEILEDVRSRLPKNAVPVALAVAEKLPLTASGKADKQALRRMLAKWEG